MHNIIESQFIIYNENGQNVFHLFVSDREKNKTLSIKDFLKDKVYVYLSQCFELKKYNVYIDFDNKYT